MTGSSFKQQLASYDHWKSTAAETATDYIDWLKSNGQASAEIISHVEQLLQTIINDKLKLAFVAEFSRGKSELINAIFFADSGRRLLPSTAGRTTMCPTELFFDNQTGESYLKLLPIETRLMDESLVTLMEDESHWVRFPLETDSPEQMNAALSEVVSTKTVDIDEAKRLGMYNADLPSFDKAKVDSLEIPKWRHALISFPHPYLKQGLSIIDTPGLNALGSEPELTLNTLPSAHAILFILAADTGVTRSDMEIWQHHINGFHSGRQKKLTVVLNKIDTLWDDLLEQEQIDQAIQKQKDLTADLLGLKNDFVFPLSAQKALLAKIKDNEALLAKSGLAALEKHLGGEILAHKQQILRKQVGEDLGHLIKNSQTLTAEKLTKTKKQLEELEELSGKSDDVIEELMAKTRVEQAQYLKDVDSFQQSRLQIMKQSEKLKAALDQAVINQLIEQSRFKMRNSWTTAGMKKVMRELFVEFRRIMHEVVVLCEQTRQLMRKIYHKFQNEHGFAIVQPRAFSVVKHRVELELLNQEADIFSGSPVTALMVQDHAIRKFFTALVSRVQEIFKSTDQEVVAWLNSGLEPLVQQIRDHKNMIEKRLNNLQKIGQSQQALESKINELQESYTKTARELTLLRNLNNRLNTFSSLNPQVRPKPKLVVQRRN